MFLPGMTGNLLGGDMKEIIVHQWRDWLLKYIGDSEYQLIKKDTQSIHNITATSFMDAENQSQLVIRSMNEEKGRIEG